MIENLTAAMAKQYVFKACGKGCRHDVTHTCDQTYSSYLTNPPCLATGVQIPVRTATDIFEASPVFRIIRGELEIRRPSVSASEIV